MKKAQRITRRSILKGLAVAGATCALRDELVAAATILDPDVASDSAAEAPKTIANFALRDVRLLDGPFREAQERDHQYLLSLDPNRLLLMFRVTSGVRTRAKPLGGWESPSCEIRGHTLGHYLSACSLMYASTGDPNLKAKCDAIVNGLAACQSANPDQGYHAGYLAAFPESFFDRVEAQKPVWAPWYVMHKIMAGLLDAHLHTSNAQALEVLIHQAEWVKFRVDRLSSEQMQRALKEEYGGMKEMLANLYGVTGNTEHLRLAGAFEDSKVFGPLTHEEDRLDGLHANTLVPKIVGVAREYELTGKPELLNIAQFFWKRVTSQRSFAIGGHGDHENFFPINDFAQHLSAATCETCGTYNMLKLTRHIFAWQPKGAVIDFYERALYNQILASQDPHTGMFAYFTPMQPGQFKMYSTPEDSFWCCVGTGTENHARYSETIYAHSDDALYVNLFIASDLNWSERGITLRQETLFPEQPATRLHLKMQRPVRLALKIRQPGWCQGQMSLMVNGKPESVKPDGSGYVTLPREWRDGEVIEVQLPMMLRMEPLPGRSDIVALFYGPILLAGKLGTDGMPKEGPYASPEIGLETQQEKFAKWPTPPVPPLPYTAGQLPSRLKPVPDQPLTYTLSVAGRPDLTLIPFFRLHHERYAIYWTTARR